MRDRTLLFVYAMLGAWGSFTYGLGPALGLLRDEQHTSRSVAGLHSTVSAVGAVVGGSIAPYLVRRFGRPASMWGGMVAAGLAVSAFCLARPLPLTLGFAFLTAVCGLVLIPLELRHPSG